MWKEIFHWGLVLIVGIATSVLWVHVINPWLDKRNRNKVHFVKPKDW